jgi:ferric-dicitrate binding protein FerR (iron transport regulator)
MKRQHYADLFRRSMERLSVDPPPGLPSDRQRLVAAVEQALRTRARRRRVVRRSLQLAFGAAAAAALALGAGELRRGQGPLVGTGKVESNRLARELTVIGTGGRDEAAVLVGSHRRSLKAGMTVGAGLTLRAPASGEVRVGTADGTQLTLEARTDLSVIEASETRRFALDTGAVRVHVSRLFAGERFIVDTTDAEVEVHGTAFRVAVVAPDPSCGGGSTTRVSVFEGVVAIRVNGGAVSVPAGQEWPAGCESAEAHAERSAHQVALRRPRQSGKAEAPAEPPGTASTADSVVVPPTRPSSPLSPLERSEPPAPISTTDAVVVPLTSPRTLLPSSDLAAQNDLFAAAVRAKKVGQLADAARLFDELIIGHPEGPLIESATVQRMKVLALIDLAAGARAAADYLARFPSGFARPEAQELARYTRP